MTALFQWLCGQRVNDRFRRIQSWVSGEKLFGRKYRGIASDSWFGAESGDQPSSSRFPIAPAFSGIYMDFFKCWALVVPDVFI
jgi:hypothetical protein